jgi:apolipoprotein N-acyltransferase
MHILLRLRENKPITIITLLIAGLMQTLSLAPYHYWYLGIVSILLILWATRAIDSSSKSLTPKQGALAGWIFGFGLFGSGASWVYISIHVYGYAPPVLATLLTLVFVMGLALFYSASFYFFFKYRTQSHTANTLLFASIWVLGDGFRTVFLTGFPWLFLGYGHLESPLAGWTPLTGVYGLTLITVFSGCAVYLLCSTIPLRQKAIIIIPVFVCWAIAPTLNHINWTHAKPKSTKQAVLFQLNIPQELKWHPSQRKKTIALLEELTEENWQHDIIVWPETAVPILLDQAIPFLNYMGEKAEQNQSSIISGIPYRKINEDNSQTLHNSIVSIGEGNGIYHKQKLVPFGEYVPLQEILRGLIAFFDLPMSDFRRGPVNQPLLEASELKISPYICYEVVYPDFVNARSKDADILLTISNDSWFGKSIGPIQHLQMAQMRAAEQGKYMIRATNNGVSAIIDEKGRITAQSEQFVRTTLSAEVKVFEGRTPFSYYGSYPVFAICALLCALILARRRKATQAGITV